MKSYFSVIVALVLLISCNSNGNKSASESPTGAINQMMAETKAGNYKSIIKHMCKKDEVAFDKIMKIAESFAALSGKSMDDLVKEQLNKSNKFSEDDMKFSNEKIDGNTATLDAENTKTKDKSTMHFVKEEGKWKLCEGIADKMDERLNTNGLLYDSITGGRKLDLDKSFDKIKEVMNDPKTKELINNPEMKERMKKTMEALQDPKKMEDLQKSIEAMKQLK